MDCNSNVCISRKMVWKYWSLFRLLLNSVNICLPRPKDSVYFIHKTLMWKQSPCWRVNSIHWLHFFLVKNDAIFIFIIVLSICLISQMKLFSYLSYWFLIEKKLFSIYFTCTRKTNEENFVNHVMFFYRMKWAIKKSVLWILKEKTILYENLQFLLYPGFKLLFYHHSFIV